MPHAPGTQPPYLHPPYVATRLRAPLQPLVLLPTSLSETTGPVFGHREVAAADSDLTGQHPGAPLGERIIVSGQVIDEDARPVRGALIEAWQANAAGRYRHKNDQHDAPLDPNFSGCGRVLTDEHGRYRFTTIRPGAYPWRNHANAWRPAHIHFSLFGAGLLSRLVTQMYFPGDPLLDLDPIFQSVPDRRARERLISAFDLETTMPEHALGYRFDVVLRGAARHADGAMSDERAVPTASQTVGPFFEIGLSHLRADHIVSPGEAGPTVRIRGRVLDGNGAPVPDVAIEIWRAASDGAYDAAGARGFGRVYPNDYGEFAFTTIRPGSTAGSDGEHAPHLVVSLFMRGLLKQLVTRVYFPDEPKNETDSVLARVPAERRSTLIAKRMPGETELAWNVVLQGPNETVFFEW